jgi:protoporphyrinogen/coproporphyrinogen III oxidase
MTADVVIVGGGIAGLACAYELHKRGVPFLLLEAGARAGGVIFSEQVDGFTIDAGPDSLLIQKPEGIELCHELGLGARLVSTKIPRGAFVQRGGRLHALPAASVLGIPTRIGPFVRTRLFSWPGKMRMAAELFVPPKRTVGDESIGAFIGRRFGREAVTYLAEPLLAGIHAGDVDRLSIGALFPRFVESEQQHGSLLKAFRRARPARESSEGVFKSLPGGLTELTSALAAALPAGSVHLRTPVERVSTSAGHQFRVETIARESIDARQLVLATPAYATATLVADLDAELAQACAAIRYTSIATVALAFERGAVAHPLTGSGFVVPRAEGSPILAATWLSSKWPNRAPEGRVLLRAFIGGARDPRALEQSDEELVRVALAALAPIVGIRGAPLFSRVYRWPRANAQHEVGHLERMMAIDRMLARHPGLFITGSGFRGVGIPDCVADGRATAGRVADNK